MSYLQENFSYLMFKLWQHFYLFFGSWVAALIIGVALSIAASRPGKEKTGKVILLLTGAGQAVPSIAVVALVFLFLGTGWTPAVVALFVYSLVPVVFNGTSGLLSVDPAVKEAARGMGMSRGQILWQLEIPLSMHALAAGARSAATMNIGSVAIAAVIGAGGLGELIYTGLKLMRVPVILAGVLPATLLAITVDLLLAAVQRRVTPPAMAPA